MEYQTGRWCLAWRVYGPHAGRVALWLGYGLVIRARPIVLANTISLALALFILGMKLRYG